MSQAESEMKITAIAPWFGAKRNLAPIIVAELGPHTAYWEPFCGSMAVLLAKPECRMETVNDMHGDLVNLARTIRHPIAGPKLYRMLRRTLMEEDLHRQFKDELNTQHEVVAFDSGEISRCDINRAYAYFISSWLGRNGVAGTRSYNNGFCVRFTGKGGHAATRFASAIDSIPAWRRRMRLVTILHADAFALLARIEDAEGTAIYCDPPYIEKGAKYVHDFTPADHERLANLLSRFRRARVVASYYDHPLLNDLYPGWTQRKIEVTKALAHQGRRGENATKATEVLLLNGPSYGEKEGLF